MEIVDPNGNVYSALDPNLPPHVMVVTEFSGLTRTIIAVDAPQAGTWTVRIGDTAGLGDVTFGAAGGVETPQLTVTSPATTITAPQVTLAYEAVNHGNATVSFYWDEDATGFDGVPIVTDLPAGSTGSHLWDVTGMADGNYSIYAVLEGGVNAPVYAYAPGAVVVPRRPQVLDVEFLYEQSPHRLLVSFDRDASGLGAPGEMQLFSVTAGTPLDPSLYSLQFDPVSHTLTITFAQPILNDGRYELRFAPNRVRDLAGNPTPDGFVSGFFFLRGDANHDERVNLSDFNILAANFGQSPRTFSEGDFNYDGRVNLSDFNILATRFGTSLPAAVAGRVGASPFSIKSMCGEERERLLAELLG